jgi:hypothetical protein
MKSEGIAPPLLTSALDGGEWSASRPSRFIPGERALSTNWMVGWVGPSVGLDAVEKKKILHCREPNPGRPARSPFLIPTRLSRLQSQDMFFKIFYSSL